MNIVPTNVPYNSLLLKQNLNTLKTTFPFIDVQTIGKSVMGDNIYCVKLRKRYKRSLLFWWNTSEMNGLQVFYL